MPDLEKLLIVRPCALGDLVLTLPAIEWIRSRHPYAHITLAGNKPFLDIALPTVDRLLDFDSREMLALLTGPEPGRCDYTHAYVFSRRRDEFVRRLEHHLAATHIPSFQTESSCEYQANFLLRGAGGTPPGIPQIRFLPGELIGDRDDRAITIHPGAGSRAKRWPLHRFREVASVLAAQSLEIQWILGPADDLDLTGAPGRVFHPRDVRSAAVRIASAGHFLGNDSGIAHLAFAAGARTLTLFGPTDPRIWASGPYLHTPGPEPSASVQDVLDRLPL